MRAPPDVVLLLLLLCLIIAALVLGLGPACRRLAHAGGGGPAAHGRRPGGRRASARPDPASSPHLVVDTLNLVHWLRKNSPAAPGPGLDTSEIVAAIDRTSAALKKKHDSRLMYVVKDRESCPADAATRQAYKDAAHRNGVYVVLTEKYADPPRGVPLSSAHSARGRDDFYVALLAWKWRCAVATEDRLRDFELFRETLQPFQVSEWAYWREAPHHDYIRPESAAYSRLRRPRLLSFHDLLPDLARAPRAVPGLALEWPQVADGGPAN